MQGQNPQTQAPNATPPQDARPGRLYTLPFQDPSLDLGWTRCNLSRKAVQKVPSPPISPAEKDIPSLGLEAENAPLVGFWAREREGGEGEGEGGGSLSDPDLRLSDCRDEDVSRTDCEGVLREGRGGRAWGKKIRPTPFPYLVQGKGRDPSPSPPGPPPPSESLALWWNHLGIVTHLTVQVCRLTYSARTLFTA